MNGKSRRFSIFIGMAALFAAISIGDAVAQVKTRLSIATGGTGGVYYPLGGGFAALISKHLPGVEATAEVTTASVDNMKLLHADKVALTLTQSDIALDAYQGQMKGFNEKVGVRTISALYSNYMHIVALDGSGIKTINDLKGKRVSTGAPGSGTEVKGLRVLEAYGISREGSKKPGSLGRLRVRCRYEGPEDRRFYLGWRLAHGGDSRFRGHAGNQNSTDSATAMRWQRWLPSMARFISSAQFPKAPTGEWRRMCKSQR